MRDPFAWSFPLGRLFGVTVRVHMLFPLVAAGLILQPAFKEGVIAGTWIDMASLMGLLFAVVLFHEFGHVFGARSVDGDSDEIMLWPLGGLANVDVPQTPRAHFITAAAGPAANVVICLVAALLLLVVHEGTPIRPPWNPFWYPFRSFAGQDGGVGLYLVTDLATWGGQPLATNNVWVVLLSRLFYVSWVTFLLNVVLIGFPLDGGRMFQAALWPRYGYRQATLAAVFAGFVFMFILLVAAIVTNQVLVAFLGVFIYMSCRQQWILLETGGEDSLFGYDFSQGYTSLERAEETAAPPRRRKQSWWQRFQQRRANRRLQREQEEREAEEARMDMLLEKVQQLGLSSLTDEERRFLKRVSDKYRNRP